MELVTPGLGLLIWMSIAFGILFILLKMFAWKPILAMIAEREKGIEDALVAAEQAKKELRELNQTNERLLLEARAERDAMLKEAREAREEVIKTAKDAAKIEADKIMVSAREAINNEKNAAMAEVKNQVATLSIEIAERIVRAELSSESKQKALNEQLLNDIKLN